MKLMKTGILLFVTLWIIVGVIYPLFITGIVHFVFPWQAEGSLIHDANGRIIGSVLIGQPFSDPKYFWSRPSATPEFPYNSLASGGSNLGPTNNELKKQILERKKTLQASGIISAIPSNLLITSSSNLDAYINLEASLSQNFLESETVDTVPSDLVMTSASGLDPHITLEAALSQVPRVAKTRGLDEEKIQKLVLANLESPSIGFLGNPRINVLELNLALNKMEDENGK